jgi:hypothetical protein
MEMMIYFFESAANGYALTTKSDGSDLRAEHSWRKVKELRLNRPKLAEVGVSDVEGALALLSDGKPYYYHAKTRTEPRSTSRSS